MNPTGGRPQGHLKRFYSKKLNVDRSTYNAVKRRIKNRMSTMDNDPGSWCYKTKQNLVREAKNALYYQAEDGTDTVG